MVHVSEKISVVVPCFNEGPQIQKSLSEICEYLSSLAPDHEVIAVDDGSTDDTLGEIQLAASLHATIRPIHYRENSGKGHAMREGFQYASGRYVIFLDADLDLHPRQLTRFFETMEQEKADVVIGSKRHPQSRVDYPKRRVLVSRIYSFFLKWLFNLPLRDTQTGLKLFKYEVLEKTFPKIVCKRFAFDVEVLANAHRLGYRIVEAPIELNFSRILRRGRMTLADLWNTGWDTLAIFYRMRLLHYYDRIHWAPRQFPPVSIIIVAHGDEEGLRGCVESCLNQEYPAEMEVLLVTHGRVEFPAHPRLTIIESSQSNRITMRDLGRAHARHDVLSFLDAPLVPVRNWLARAVRNLGDPEIAAVSGPRLASPGVDVRFQQGWRLAAALLGRSSLRYRYISKSSRNNSSCAIDHLIVRKSVLNEVVRDFKPDVVLRDGMIGWVITKHRKQIIAYDPEVIVYRSKQ